MPTYDPGESQPLDSDFVPIQVVRFLPDKEGDDRFELLPNLHCEMVQRFEGSKVAAARFSYLFDDTDPESPYPSQFDAVWPLVTPESPYGVRTDDRLLVYGVTAAGKKRLLFNGFAQIPQVDLTGRSQSVTFTAAGVEVRFWDAPVGGATVRDTDSLVTSGALFLADALPVQFNPLRKANCSPDGADENFALGSTGFVYPVFVDVLMPVAPSTPASATPTFWTLDKAARFLFAVYNSNEEYVDNPPFDTLAALLKSRRPKGGSEYYDPTDPATYDEEPVVLRDCTATGRAWPEFLEEQLRFCGFTFAWRVEEQEDGSPYNFCEVYRLDAAPSGAPKEVTLTPTRTSLDQFFNNLSAMSVARDHNELFNQVRVETDPVLYEVSVVLAPLFPIAAGDEAFPARDAFKSANLAAATAAVRKAYRVWGCSEGAEPHWDYDTSTMIDTPIDLKPVLGTANPAGFPGPNYVVRNRPGRNTLISVDNAGKPLRAQLAISTNYQGKTCALWDGTGTWQDCGEAHFRLLKDRLGVAINADDPEAWKIAKPSPGAATVITGGVVNAITRQAAPHANAERFYLRLTTVIESDAMLDAVAKKRVASPSEFAVERRIDARDHYAREILAANSLYNPGNQESVERDDTDAALAYAAAVRSANEFPRFAGSLTIPFLTNAYDIGDRISKVAGREVDLRTNGGDGQDEAAVYPAVVGLTWDFSGGGQRTVLQLSDRRSEPRTPDRSVLTGENV